MISQKVRTGKDITLASAYLYAAVRAMLSISMQPSASTQTIMFSISLVTKMFSISLGTGKALQGWLGWLGLSQSPSVQLKTASSAEAHQRLELVADILYVLFCMCHLGDLVIVARYVLARMLHRLEYLQPLPFQRMSQACIQGDSS